MSKEPDVQFYKGAAYGAKLLGDIFNRFHNIAKTKRERKMIELIRKDCYLHAEKWYKVGE